MPIVSSVQGSLSAYYEYVKQGIGLTSRKRGGVPEFEVGWDLPELDETLVRFFEPTGLKAYLLPAYADTKFQILDLTENGSTRTTKTFGSALIVARAVAHTQRSGEPVVLVTPSSANKAVGLRDAVFRAYQCGLTDPDRLRVVTVVPESSLPKLWASPLANDPTIAALNPMGIYRGPDRESVKTIAADAVQEFYKPASRNTRFRVWYTLNPDNYMVADLVRSVFEATEFPPQGERWHVQAVSSAYGLLGHDLGRQLTDQPSVNRHCYLLVQHLETPDLVEAATGIDISSSLETAYDADGRGLLQRRIHSNPRFPKTCISLTDRVERTFYTRNPSTTPAILELLSRNKGDGILVSISECLRRYPEVLSMARKGGYGGLPSDPRKLREWALVMAFVGAMAAVDEGIIPSSSEVLLHNTGAYGEDDFYQMDVSSLTQVANAQDMLALIAQVAR